MNLRLEPAIQPVAWIFLATSFFPTPSSPVRRTGKRESLTSKTKDHRLCISSLFPTIGSNLSEVDNRHSCSAETSRRTPQLAVDPSEKGNPFRKVGKSSSSGKTSPLLGKSSNRVQGRTGGKTAGVRQGSHTVKSAKNQICGSAVTGDPPRSKIDLASFDRGLACDC